MAKRKVVHDKPAFDKEIERQVVDAAKEYIVKAEKWILLKNGTSDQREKLATVAHSYGLKFGSRKERKFKIVGCAGCSGESIVNCIFGKNITENFTKLLKIGGFGFSEIEKHLDNTGIADESPILNLLMPDRTLFVDNLQCNSQADVMAVAQIGEFTRKLKNIRYPSFTSVNGWNKSTSIAADNRLGMFILGVDSWGGHEEKLQDFIKMFTVIPLIAGTGKKKNKQKRQPDISDKFFMQTFKDAETELHQEAGAKAKQQTIFNLTSEKLIKKYGKEKGYTPGVVSNRYFEIQRKNSKKVTDRLSVTQ